MVSRRCSARTARRRTARGGPVAGRSLPGCSAVLDPGREAPRCWWAPFGTIAENDFDVAGSWYKPRVGEEVPGENPVELIREVLAIEREITTGIEKLLKEIEA